MAIKIKRNEEGNCITFEGSSNPVYWNACLSGEVDESQSGSINVVNDIITAQTGIVEYEFFRIPFEEFVDADGNGFATAQEAADYITANANVIGLGGGGTDLSGVEVCFSLDDTTTSIMLDNGYSYGVNTIKAVGEPNGTISLKSQLGDITYFTKLQVGNVCINGVTLSGGLNDQVNSLNELFSVGAFQSVVIADPYSTMIADITGSDTVIALSGSTVVDPIGNDIAANSTNGNYAGITTDITIDQAGEYYTFDIRGEGQIGFGLVHTSASYAAEKYQGNANYADPDNFCVINSAHYGFQFSHWFHPTPNGSWTNYGANTSYVMRPGWSNWDQKQDWLDGNPVKIRCGIDENGYISISSLQNDGSWEVHARSGYQAPEGAEYRLGIKFGDTKARLYSTPKAHLLEPAAPTMYFRYIESPDGVYQYPIFTTEEEADYYDLNFSGSGTHETIVFPDDPTFNTWYIPTTGYESSGATAPSGETFLSNPATYTEISSLVNQDLAPSSFTLNDITVNEEAVVNIAVAPADASFTTSVSGLPAGLSLSGLSIVGNAPTVANDYITNPSDTYTITVTRTNSYGNTSTTFDVIVTNLTAPATAVSGSTWVSDSTPLVDSDTLDDGSMVNLDDAITDNQRFIIPQDWVETYVLPALTGSGDYVALGVLNSGVSAPYSSASFDVAMVWDHATATSHHSHFLKDGTLLNTTTIGSRTDAFYDYAFEISGSNMWVIGCNFNDINTQPSPNEGGTFSRAYSTSYDGTAPLTLSLLANGTSMDFQISGSSLVEITTPAPSTPSNLTDWDKAVDFSGGSEYLVQVNNSYLYSPLNMGNASSVISAPATGQTVSSGHPWATTIVFNADRNSSNQHIWNSGEGTSSGNDNMYLRLSASGQLYFGWGREGVGYNEKQLATILGGQWYGVYIGHTGARFNSSNATATNLDAAFDIRVARPNDLSNDVDASQYFTTPVGYWTSTGVRMDRSVTGTFTIGGRGSNRNFHGKVASMVITTLRCGVAMPDSTEIKMMITDPVKWVTDYKVSNAYRRPSATTDTSNFQLNSLDPNSSTQVWLMGDGSLDNYSNGIRNYIYPAEQNRSKIQFNNMVSSDIENVSITGL